MRKRQREENEINIWDEVTRWLYLCNKIAVVFIVLAIIDEFLLILPAFTRGAVVFLTLSLEEFVVRVIRVKWSSEV